MSVSDALIRRSSRARRWLGLTAAIVITMTLTAGSASATVGERERVFKNPYEFTAWDCGYPMQVVGVETHFIHVRTDRRVDGNVFFTNNYSWRETWTAADGRSFTISGNGIFKDVQAKSLGGSLYQFAFHENGQPFVLKDSSGKVISRDRGNLTGSYTFDFGTGEFNFLGNKLHGPHPMFGVDLCKAVAPLTGISDSSKYLTERPIGSTDSAVGLRRIPAAELHGDRRARARCSCSSTATGENGDGTPGGDRQAGRSGHPEVHQRRWLADRSAVRRPCPAARRGSPGFPCRRVTASSSVAPAGCRCSTTRETINRPSARRPTRSMTSSTTRSPTTTSTRRACISPGCRAARSGSGSTSGSTAAMTRSRRRSRSPVRDGPANRRHTAALGDDTDLGVHRPSRGHGRPTGQHRADDGAPGRLWRPGRTGEADRLPGSGPQQLGSGVRRGERRRHLFLDARLHESLRNSTRSG